jgi:adenylate cyclase
MKLTFRVTLLAILLGLLSSTVAVLGAASYFNLRFAADDLGHQILDQTSLRVEEEIARMLDGAITPSRFSLNQLQAGHWKVDDFTDLIGHWEQLLRVSPHLTSLYIGRESDGASTGITRLRRGHNSVWESAFNATAGRHESREYWIEDYPRKTITSDPPQSAPDIRTRPWYVEARKKHGPVWTDTFVFLGVSGVENIHGLTFATPYYGAEGELRAVIDADFDLGDLCRFFETLKVGQNGLAFVVELRADGSQFVIAHPDEKILTQATASGSGSELVPADQLADGRVPAFLHAQQSSKKGDTPFRFDHNGTTFLGKRKVLTQASMPRWMICSLVPEEDILARVHRSTLWALLIGVLAAAVAVAVSFYVSSQVAGPLERLADETQRIGRMSVEPQPIRHSVVAEVDRLAVAVEDMKTGLRSFQKYVPAGVVRSLVETRREAVAGGERRRVTTLFSDIAGFTAHSERMKPEELVEHLREYFAAITAEILLTGGTVDKYIGDAVMAFWGAPEDDPDQALAACTAALRIQERLVDLRKQWATEGRVGFHSRIGINTGDVIAGNIGSDARLNYTVIGDAVNVASRIEGVNKQYGTEIIVADTTFMAAGPKIIARPLDWVAVVGKAEAVLIYELLGLTSEGVPREPWIDAFAEALEHYRRCRWNEAIALLEQVLEDRPGDRPSQRLLDLCRGFLVDPPSPEWDGVFRSKSK